MILPAGRDDRYPLYLDVLQRCEVSREVRRQYSAAMRQWFLYGSVSGRPARYNKIQEHVRASASYLYAPDGMRLGVSVPKRYGDHFIEEQEAASDEMLRLWSDSGASLLFALGVEWAHVYPSVVFKVVPDFNEPTLHMIGDFADFGVLQEDIPDLDKQEAFCHWYTVSLSVYRRMIVAAFRHNPEQAKALIEAAERSASPAPDRGASLPPAVERLVLSSASPNMTGSVNATLDTIALTPMVEEPVVQMAELWVWDDHAFHDKGTDTYTGEWRVVTILCDPETVLYDPLNAGVPGEHAFHFLTLEPTVDTVWGQAHIARLTQLQDLRETRLNQLDRLVELTLESPIAATGVSGILEEKLKALNKPGGIFVNSMPQGSVQRMAPPIPPDAYEHIHEIDRMFSVLGGLPMALRGQTEPGVRSGEQASVQAMLGAGPTLSRAMRAEQCLESITTAMFRLLRRVSKTPLRKAPRDENDPGEEFLLAQLPDEATVRVSAHSHSPIYREQLTQKAIAAMDRQAIDAEEFVELLGLPMHELARAKARKLSRQKAAQAAKVLDMKQKESEAKVLKATGAAKK